MDGIYLNGKPELNNQVKISIITPCYNRANELLNLLESLADQTIDKNLFELIICDDGSTDSTSKLINNWQKKNFFKIKYLKQENKGPGAARNLGLENSDGDLIAFIDSDCEADINWLDIIYRSYKKNNFDACGGPDGSKENFTILQKAIDYSMTSFLTTGGMRGHSKKMIATFYPRTHNMAVKKSLYLKIGGFGSLRHGQDIEFSNRMIRSGAYVKFLKDAIVYHRRRTSLKQFFKQVFNWGVARINLYMLDDKMLELVHFLPSFALIGSVMTVFISIYLNLPLSKLAMLFILPLSFVSFLGCYQKKDFRIFPLLLLVIPIQIFGYGLGFIKAYILRVLLKKSEFTGFVKNYYK